MVSGYHQREWTPPDDVDERFVQALISRAADLAAEAEIGGAFVHQLPLLSAWEWLALRALHAARNRLKAEAEKEAEEKHEREKQRAELAAKLGR